MSKIEWCDETWQVVSGCTPVTAGCHGCYSAQLCGTRLKHNPRTAGLTRKTADGRHVFTGEVRCHDDQLEKPLRWRKPRRIFVADRGDLFHDAVPEAFIDRVFAVMALCPQHTFMVLTKRPRRMREYLAQRAEGDGDLIPAAMGNIDYPRALKTGVTWPLPNVEVGTSISDQPDADAMLPDLLRCLSARHFVSYEPALGPVDFTRVHYDGVTRIDALNGHHGLSGDGSGPSLDQIIFGGESGVRAWRRPVDLAWARSARDQCKAAGVAFFMKQVDKVQPIPDDLMIREWPS